MIESFLSTDEQHPHRRAGGFAYHTSNTIGLDHLYLDGIRPERETRQGAE